MTITLELTPEQEAKLQGQARASGVAPADYLRRLLDEAPAPPAAPARTGADALAELKALNLPKGYGDPSVDSPELARQLRRRFARRDHSPESGR